MANLRAKKKKKSIISSCLLIHQIFKRRKKSFFHKLFYAFFVTNIMKKHFHYRFAVAHRKAPIRKRHQHIDTKINFSSSSPTVFIENFPLWEHGRFSSFIFVISHRKKEKENCESFSHMRKICFVLFINSHINRCSKHGRHLCSISRENYQK